MPIQNQSMKHLVPHKRDMSMALNTMFGRQEDFAKRFKITNNMTEAEREKWTKEFLLCIISEAGELLDQINWKHWKKERKKINQHEIRFEIIDLQHFVLSLAIVWGMSANDLFAYFMAKSDENINRQKKGY